MKFSFLELVLFTGVIQGIFLLVCLQFISQKNKNANKILAIIIGLATFLFAGKMALFKFQNAWIWRIALLADCSIYLFGPLLYAYYKALIFQKSSKYILSFKHYIPSIFLFLFFCWTLTLSTNEYVKLSYTVGMFIAYFLMELTGIVSLLFYAFISYRVVTHLKNRSEEKTTAEKSLIRFLQSIAIGVPVMTLFWIVGFYKTYIMHTQSSYISYNLFWIAMTIFLFIIAYFSLTQPEIVRSVPVVKKKIDKSRLKSEEITVFSSKLNTLIVEEQIYIHPDLSLKELAKKVGTSANNLSWLLNTVYGKTFYEFVNEYRIHAFLEKIEKGEHKKQTILAIALDSGFNSKSTFNKSFKMIMNDTPSRYIEKNFSS